MGSKRNKPKRGKPKYFFRRRGRGAILTRICSAKKIQFETIIGVLLLAGAGGGEGEGVEVVERGGGHGWSTFRWRNWANGTCVLILL
jgi:hypothetical protein